MSTTEESPGCSTSPWVFPEELATFVSAEWVGQKIYKLPSATCQRPEWIVRYSNLIPPQKNHKLNVLCRSEWVWKERWKVRVLYFLTNFLFRLVQIGGELRDSYYLFEVLCIEEIYNKIWPCFLFAAEISNKNRQGSDRRLSYFLKLFSKSESGFDRNSLALHHFYDWYRMVQRWRHFGT